MVRYVPRWLANAPDKSGDLTIANNDSGKK